MSLAANSQDLINQLSLALFNAFVLLDYPVSSKANNTQPLIARMFQPKSKGIEKTTTKRIYRRYKNRKRFADIGKLLCTITRPYKSHYLKIHNEHDKVPHY